MSEDGPKTARHYISAVCIEYGGLRYGKQGE